MQTAKRALISGLRQNLPQIHATSRRPFLQAIRDNYADARKACTATQKARYDEWAKSTGGLCSPYKRYKARNFHNKQLFEAEFAAMDKTGMGRLEIRHARRALFNKHPHSTIPLWFSIPFNILFVWSPIAVGISLLLARAHIGNIDTSTLTPEQAEKVQLALIKSDAMFQMHYYKLKTLFAQWGEPNVRPVAIAGHVIDEGVDVNELRSTLKEHVNQV